MNVLAPFLWGIRIILLAGDNWVAGTGCSGLCSVDNSQRSGEASVEGETSSGSDTLPGSAFNVSCCTLALSYPPVQVCL